MPFFMINLDTEAWTPNNFEVEAATSGRAVVRVLEKLRALDTERILHSIHVSPPYDSPTTDEEMASWNVENHFLRLQN
jgi:hypothetical protein